jgi:hypothetical protein
MGGPQRKQQPCGAALFHIELRRRLSAWLCSCWDGRHPRTSRDGEFAVRSGKLQETRC